MGLCLFLHEKVRWMYYRGNLANGIGLLPRISKAFWGPGLRVMKLLPCLPAFWVNSGLQVTTYHRGRKRMPCPFGISTMVYHTLRWLYNVMEGTCELLVIAIIEAGNGKYILPYRHVYRRIANIAALRRLRNAALKWNAGLPEVGLIMPVINMQPQSKLQVKYGPLLGSNEQAAKSNRHHRRKGFWIAGSSLLPALWVLPRTLKKKLSYWQC